MTQDTNRPVKTTATSITILEALKEFDGATVTELMTHTGLAKSTVHNHLQTLLNAEYVRKENNTYHVGFRLFHLGEYTRKRKEELVPAKKIVHQLATETQMEADFNVESYGRLINLYDFVGHTGESGWEVGTYFHMHSTSAGKAILAEFPLERVDEIIEKYGLPKQTDKTITDREELLSELETIREQGYAENDGECFAGYKTIARAVHSPDGSILGSIAVGGPGYMIGDQFNRSTHRALEDAVTDLESAAESMVTR